MIRTKEGAETYEHSLNHALEFFSKAGSLFERKGETFYEGEETALSLFQKTWIVDKELSMKLLLWLRDCRGGAGNRSGARACYKWLADTDPNWLIANVDWLPQVGRWDDLRVLFGTEVEKEAVKCWGDAIVEGNVLAAKWADRSDRPLREFFHLTEGAFRWRLANIRKNHIVEHKMCAKNWREVDYPTIPSVAMARYTNAFGRNDAERFNKYKEKLAKGETTVHASVLFPHDCVRTVKHGDKDIANAQFNAMPDFMEGTDERIIVISDTSGSMTSSVSGIIEAVDISQGMALYCSAKISKDNPFHKKFIAFCSESEFKNWDGMEFSEAVMNTDIFDRAVGSTRIDKALDLILSTARYFNITQEQMPTALIIVSDMQFHQGADNSGTEVEKCLREWDAFGYNRPKIVYWNTAGYAGSPDVANSNNVALISGFSPAVLKSLFKGEDFSPVAIMMQALEKYYIYTLYTN